MSPRRRNEATAEQIDLVASRQQVIDKLKTVYDPELGVSVYDLGLIYDVDVSPAGIAHITMTLTARECPAGEIIPMEVEAAALEAPDVRAARVTMVWDPPWSPALMSDSAKKQLGFT